MNYAQLMHQGLAPQTSMANGGGGSDQQSAPASTSSTQTKEIPTWAQGYSKDLLARSYELSNTPYQTYDGQRIADMNQQQQAGLNQVTQRATNGSPEENAARQNYTDTMSGKFLDPSSNPYLQKSVNMAMNDVSGKVNSQFGGSNYGTTAHQETLTRNLSDAANQAYGQNYTNERNNQLKDASLASQYGNIDYNNAQQMIGVGDIYRQENQDQLNTKYSDWLAAQNQPYRQLDVLANGLGAAVNGQGSVQSAGYASNPYTTNRYANSIGAGLAGYGLLSSATNGDISGAAKSIFWGE